MKKKILIITFIFFSFFISCKSIEDNKVDNKIKEKKEVEIIEDFNEKYVLQLLKKYEFFESFDYCYNKYYKVKDKFPLQKEKIFIYSFVSLFYYIFSYYSDNKELKELNNINENFNIEEFNNIFFNIYLEYKYNFKISENKNIFELFFILSFFIKNEYSSFIYRVNSSKNFILNLEPDIVDFLYYLQSFSYIKIYNIKEALQILNLIKNDTLKEKIQLYIEYFINNNLINSNLIYYKIIKSQFILENKNFYFFSLLDPLKIEIFEPVKKFNFINFYKEIKTKESLPYRAIYFKGYFFVGTFLSGLYVFSQNGELSKYYTPYNSKLVSLFIRNFFIYKEKLYIITYEGINEVYVKDNKIEILRDSNFPLNMNYNSLFENEQYIVCSTHFNGVFIWDKKYQKLSKILDKSICETAYIFENYLFIGTLKNGFSIYDLKNKKFIKTNILTCGNDIKSFDYYEGYIYICSYRNGIFNIDYNKIKNENKIELKNLISSSILDYLIKIKIANDFLYIISINGGILKINLNNFNMIFINNFEKIKITDINYNDNIFVISTYEQGIYAFFGYF